MTSETLPLAAPLEEEPAAEEQRGWSFPARFGLRFAIAFLLAIHLPSPFYMIPWLGSLFIRVWSVLPDRITPWIVRTLFGIARPMRSGSGDTPYNYAEMAAYLILGLLVAAVWSLIDRRRIAYPRLLEVFRIYVRFILAEAMIGYGTAKVFPSQFPQPSLDKLVQPLGDFSPMGLLWAFMGHSPAYTIFTGAAELLGAILITIRRTVLLGALVIIGVMVNVVALNLFYDVPVKIYSTQLLLLAIFLAMPHLHRLAKFFILNQPVPADRSEPLVRNRRWQIVLVVLRTVVVIWYVWAQFEGSRQSYDRFYGQASPLRGIWNVETINVDGVERPPLVTDLTRWRRFVFDYAPFASFYGMDDRRHRFNVKVNEAKRTIELTSRDDAKRKATLTYERLNAETLIVAGRLDGKVIRAVCRRGPEEFFLTRRGFHWVNERPVNR